MIRIQNVSRKAILTCLIPILVGAIMMEIICSKTPLRVLAPIIEVKVYDLVLSSVTKNVVNMANSADPDETPHFSSGSTPFVNAPYSELYA